jgi:hypothetical protein
MIIKKQQTRNARLFMIITSFLVFLLLGIISFVVWQNNAVLYSTELLQDFSHYPAVVPEAPKVNDVQTIITADPFHRQQDALRAVFYNIYGDPRQNETSFFETIVLEQIQQIGESHAATIPLVLYYNTVGHAFLHGPAFTQTVQTRCQALGLTCVHMAHYQRGFEEITLQDAYQFCQKFPDRQMIYLHNKGSYNGGKRREKWRRHMTRAITDKLCLDRITDQQCSTCGLLFQPVWTLFYPGNFFTARCDYVQQLIAPNEFEARTDAMLAQRPKEIRGAIFAEKRDTRGEDRFATEHWIGSHPSIQPCHLSTHADLTVWLDKPKLPFRFMTATDLPLDSKWILSDLTRTKTILQDKSSRMRDAYLLAGLLWKWQSFYQQYPAENSWIWKYFPDGDEWRQRVYASNDTSLRKILDDAWRETPASLLWIEQLKSLAQQK